MIVSYASGIGSHEHRQLLRPFGFTGCSVLNLLKVLSNAVQRLVNSFSSAYLFVSCGLGKECCLWLLVSTLPSMLSTQHGEADPWADRKQKSPRDGGP